MRESGGSWAKRWCKSNAQHSFFPITGRDFAGETSFDFALAQSIFSHCGLDLIKRWLSAISCSLAQNGALVATFLIGEEDSAQTGWIYPDCVNYRPTTLERAAKDVNLRFEILDWEHPRQTWALFAAPGFDSTWFKDRPLTWNAGLERALSQRISD